MSSNFERVPGRCGGRLTLIGRRLEPGMFYRLHESGVSTTELACQYDVSIALVEASFDICRKDASVLTEFDNRNR